MSPPSRLRRPIPEILLVAASTAVVLLVFEVAVRVSRADRPRPTGYAPVNTALRVNRHENSRGYRDQERTLRKPPGVRRVVVMGDSFSWGVGVMFEDTYPHRLENALRARRGEPWEVVNLSLRGMNTVEEAAKLASEGMSYDPDLVLIGYCLNDAEDQTPAELRRAQDWLERRQNQPRRLLLDRSALFRLVKKRIEATAENRRRLADFQSLYTPAAAGWASARTALRNMVGLCEPRGIPMMVAIFPLFSDPLDARYPFTAIHQQIAQAAAAAGARVVDLLPAYRELRSDILVIDGAADEHPNEIAHRIAANVLARAIDRVLPAVSRSPVAGEVSIDPTRSRSR